MSNCNDGRYNCGPKVSSACVDYTGKPPKSFDLSEVPCKPNVNDIIEKFDDLINNIDKSIDLTSIDKKCLSFDPTKITVSELSQIFVDELCGIKAQIQSLQSQIADIDVLSQHISIDVSCLFGSNNCQPTTQTVGTLLSLLVSELCTLKTQING